MSYRELIDALYKECDERIARIREESEKEAEEIRRKGRDSIEGMREARKRACETAVTDEAESILMEATGRARAVLLSAGEGLEKRLYGLSLGCLGGLRNERYNDFFVALVRELPSAGWGTVRVNPDDMGLAKSCMDGVEVMPDDNITGGLEAATRDKSLRVINTLEKRLERAWPGLLPEVMREVEETLMKDA